MSDDASRSQPGVRQVDSPTPDTLRLDIDAPPEEHEQLLRIARSLIDHRRSVTQLSQALQDAPALPGSATLSALRELESAWGEVDRRYRLLTPGEAAAACGSRTRNPAQWLTDKVRGGFLFAPRRGGHRVVPAFQLDGAGPRAGLVLPLRLLRGAGWRDTSILFWFTTPSPRLGGSDPATTLSVDASRVAMAAEQVVQPW